jgi:tetraacyldisaccharide 4'-kinase
VLRWPDAILVQSEQDRDRYLLAGAPASNVRVAGNLKYDFTPPPAAGPFLADEPQRGGPKAEPQRGGPKAEPQRGGPKAEPQRGGPKAEPQRGGPKAEPQRGGPIWIAASTTAPVEAGDPDEDDVVIDAFQKLSLKHPGMLLILAPRRPERFDVVAAKLQAAGVSFARRSAQPADLPRPGVLLLDSIGELAGLFERATVVFMGGTLARRGGHNILEPAFFGKPVIVGPHMENFAAIIDEFSAAGAVVPIADAGALAAAAEALLADAAKAAEIGARARALAQSKRGTADRIAAELLARAGEGVPNPVRALDARLTLGPLSLLWTAGNAANISRSKPKSLQTRVISVGGLAMGGAGKSPLALHLARKLADAGQNLAILTRGYGRKSRLDTIVARGETAPVAHTGDEAQMFLRQGVAHVGIGADRYEVGRKMEQQLHPGVFLLDDGFQHFGLKRDHDIVLIDALDPLGGGVFPLGRLREPMSALARATVVVITRAEYRHTGIERMIRQHNAKAPIFRSRVVVTGEIPQGRLAAFCGLGQPRTFWRTLDALGSEIILRMAFPDHHRYSSGDLEEICRQASAAGAEALVTTEKDWMNLSAGVPLPLTIHCLRIGIEIDDETVLLKHILSS